ncbi:MAG: hypothetical protein ACTSQP_04865 [Promethearchaeota archaeon]
MARLAIGIIVGTILSLFSVSIVSGWAPLSSAAKLFNSNIILALTTLLSANFGFDFISIITSLDAKNVWAVSNIIAAWLITGYVAGSIAKGASRGLICGLLVAVIALLLWILLGVFANIDIMSLFQGSNLMSTIGGIVGAIVCGLIGGLLGGAVSGPYEEFL